MRILPSRLGSLVEKSFLIGCYNLARLSSLSGRRSRPHVARVRPLSYRFRGVLLGSQSHTCLSSWPGENTHLLGLPPQDYFLLALLRLQGPDLKLKEKGWATSSYQQHSGCPDRVGDGLGALSKQLKTFSCGEMLTLPNCR